MVAAFAFTVPAWAEIPPTARQDPRFQLGYLVATCYSGVKSDGSGDSTAGLQQAMDDACQSRRVVLLPLGIYQISDTLRAYKWLPWNREKKRAWIHPEEDWKYAHFLLGECRDGRRPLVRLATQAPLFDEVQQPRPLVKFGGFVALDEGGAEIPAPDSFHPLSAPAHFRPDSSFSFYQEWRGIDLDCNGHRGAIGLSFPAAQYCTLLDTRIEATGAAVGIDGLPGRNSGAANIEVHGGRIGLRLGALAGVTLVGCRLLGQDEVALELRDFVPLMAVGLEITKDRAPAIRLQGAVAQGQRVVANGSMSLVDARLEVGDDGLVIDNQAGCGLYLRNVFIKGPGNLLQSSTCPVLPKQGEWSLIREYAFAAPFSGVKTEFNYPVHNILDGQVTDVVEPVKTMGTANPPPPDLLARHLWSTLPSPFDGGPAPMVVTLPPYEAIPNDASDAADSIQRAIDDAHRAGHGRVFLPAGTFLIGKTIVLRKQTVLFGSGLKTTVLQNHPTWKPETQAFLIDTDDDAEATTVFANVCLKVLSRQTPGLAHADRDPHDRFSRLRWRSGRRSLSLNVMIHEEPWTKGNPTWPKQTYTFSGSGGGRHYFVMPGLVNDGNNEVRLLKVQGTYEPLSIYGLNLEGFATPERWREKTWEPYATCAEIQAAANVRLYGIKREGEAASLVLRDCTNIALFCSGGMRENVYHGCGGYVQVLGRSTNLLLANLLVQFAKPERVNGEALLREALDGSVPHLIPWPESLGLYRRGPLRDEAMGYR